MIYTRSLVENIIRPSLQLELFQNYYIAFYELIFTFRYNETLYFKCKWYFINDCAEIISFPFTF